MAEILVDGDANAALRYLEEVVAEKIRCYQYESHRTAFEGGTGDEPSHYLQRGEGHPKQE